MPNTIRVNDEIFESRGFWFEWDGQGLLVRSVQYKEMKMLFPWEYLYEMTQEMEREFGRALSEALPQRTDSTGGTNHDAKNAKHQRQEVVASSIVRRFADQISIRITRTVIAQFKRSEGILYCRDDYGLNFWDEICVHMQNPGIPTHGMGQHDQIVGIVLIKSIEKLEPHEWEALWIGALRRQSQGSGLKGDSDPLPRRHDVIAEYLATEYVYQLATKWSNHRIQHFLSSLEDPASAT